MDFEQLRIFIAVVQQGSFTRAAKSLYISHSTTSRSVAALEQSLGIRLLARNSRNLVPTAAGELLFNKGREILESVLELENEVCTIKLDIDKDIAL